MEGWIRLKEAAELLGVSPATVRYRALKKGMYAHRREEREYGETVVVSTRSLLERHPELKENLEQYPKAPPEEDATAHQAESVSTASSPEDGPESVHVTLETSATGTAKPVPTDEVVTKRIRTLLDKLEEIKIQESRIKEQLKTLFQRL